MLVPVPGEVAPMDDAARPPLPRRQSALLAALAVHEGQVVALTASPCPVGGRPAGQPGRCLHSAILLRGARARRWG